MPPATPSPIPTPDPPGAPVLEMVDAGVASLKDPGLEVLTGVNWSVATGDYWVVGGLHASGKSDLMALAAGIMPPMRGHYRIFGRESMDGFERDRLALRRRLSLVFDGGHLLNDLTIAENISLPLRYHQNCYLAGCAERVEALLALAELEPWADRYPARVPRNRQQRAGLARALALPPDVLLVDSPLSGLDPRDMIWWLDLLGRLSAGHPIMNHRPVTLIVTGDDLRPWRGHARQFAAISNHHFRVLNVGRGAPESEDQLWQDWWSEAADRDPNEGSPS
jgi:putative ABC transport system ATP-binding protein